VNKVLPGHHVTNRTVRPQTGRESRS
jgi:hypothetical protein